MRIALSEFSMWFCNHYCNDSPVDFYGPVFKGNCSTYWISTFPQKWWVVIVDSHGSIATSNN